MSGERRAGDAPDPRQETPAPEDPRIEERPAAAATPLRQGITAALALFAVAVMVELLALGGVRLSGDPDANVGGVFLTIGFLIFVGGSIAAIAVSARLPRAARGPFWAMGVLCAFATVILWGVTCGLAGTPRIGG